MNTDTILSTFAKGIKDTTIKTKQFKYINGHYVFKVKKKTHANDIIHNEIRIFNGQISYKTTILTEHPIIWTRDNQISRKRIRKFKDKYVICSVEYFDLLTLFIFHDIFVAYMQDRDEKVIYEINEVLERYKPFPLRGSK